MQTGLAHLTARGSGLRTASVGVVLLALLVTGCSGGDKPDKPGRSEQTPAAARTCTDEQISGLPEVFDADGCRVVDGASHVGERLLWGIGDLPDGAEAPEQPTTSAVPENEEDPSGAVEPTPSDDPALTQDAEESEGEGEWVIAWDPTTGEPTPIAQLPGGSWNAWTVTIDLKPTFLVVGKRTVDGRAVPYARGWDVNTTEQQPTLEVDGDADFAGQPVAATEGEDWAILGDDNVYVPGAELDLETLVFRAATEPVDGEVSVPDGPQGLGYHRLGMSSGLVIAFAQGEAATVVDGRAAPADFAGYVGLTTYGAVAWSRPVRPEPGGAVPHLTAVVGGYAVDVAVREDDYDVSWVETVDGGSAEPSPADLGDGTVQGDDVVVGPGAEQILFLRLGGPPLLLDVASGEVAEIDAGTADTLRAVDGATAYLEGRDGGATIDLTTGTVEALPADTLVPSVVGAAGALFPVEGGGAIWAPRSD